jgi:hypothetical protein
MEELCIFIEEPQAVETGKFDSQAYLVKATLAELKEILTHR